jgi:hypothetical protein
LLFSARRRLDVRDGDAGGAEPHDHDMDRVDPLPGQPQRVVQGGQGDDRGTVLVVVEHRDVELGLQPRLDLEATRRRDVLQVDAAEAGRDRLDGGHDLVHVGGVQADREGVDAGELLEQHRLTLHHRHCGPRADVAQAQHRRPVGDDRHRVAFDRVLEGLVGVLLNRRADAGDARRVGHREIVARLQRTLVVLLDLAPDVQHERPVGGVQDTRARNRIDGVGEPRPVAGVAGLDGDVADRVRLIDGHQVDGPDRRPGVADRRCDLAEHPGHMVDLDA